MAKQSEFNTCPLIPTLAVKTKPQRLKSLSLAQQAAGLRAAYPFAEICISRNVLTWRDWLQPLAFSMRYFVEITYRLREMPTTRLLRPSFRELAGERVVPHVYDQKRQELCLFYPDGREWNSAKAISSTIASWASEWIVHFESWLFTERWDGGGVHIRPGAKSAPPACRR